MHPHAYHSGGVSGSGGVALASLGVANNGDAAAAAAAGRAAVLIGEKVPSLMIDRPKMPRSTWEALRGHIVKERNRKKHQIMQSKEEERMKKERERKKKQEALTLEETKEEIANSETKLAHLKEEKHQLFHTLKKVLYEDDRRRSKEVSHPQVYLQPTMRPNPYMKPQPHLLMPQQQQVASHLAGAAMQSSKRQRSPSPPRNSIPAAYHRTVISTAATLPSSYVSSTKFSPYSTSTAVSSVSAASIYAHAAAVAASQPGYHYSSEAAIAAAAAAAADRVSKTVYLPQPSELVRSSPIVTAAQSRAYSAQSALGRAANLASQPPLTSAHALHRSSNMLYNRSSYPVSTTTAAVVAAAAAAAAAGSRIQQPPQNGSAGIRYFSQRD